MTLATLSDVLQPALAGKYAVAGLVTLGWEDMRAYVEAAGAESCPVILQAGPSCRAHTPLPILGQMFHHLANEADVPVVAHLDHGYTMDECKAALDAGFTSLMFDGSRKPLAQNIDETAAVAELAHGAGISARVKSALLDTTRERLPPAPTLEKRRSLPATPASTRWQSRLATCICNGTSPAVSTRPASRRSRP